MSATDAPKDVVNAVKQPEKQAWILEQLANGFVKLDNPKESPVQDLLDIPCGSGSTFSTFSGTGVTPGQKKMIWDFGGGSGYENMVAKGSHLVVQFASVTTTVVGGTPVTASGVALPNGISGLIDTFIVKVGTVVIHNIANGFGLLKRKLTDLCASAEWINGYGGVKAGYVLDPEFDGTVGSVANGTSLYGYRGFNKLYSNTAQSLRYQFDLLPNGFLDRYLPLGFLKPIHIELWLISDPSSVLGYNFSVAPTSVNVVVNTPSILLPVYMNKEMHDRVVANFKGYYDDWDYTGKQIASGTSGLQQIPLNTSRISTSGLIGVFRPAADIIKNTNAGTDGTSYVLLDKMGQCSNLALGTYYFKYNNQQIPANAQLDGTNGITPYEMMEQFQHNYSSPLRDYNYAQNSGYYYSSMLQGGGGYPIPASGTASVPNPWFSAGFQGKQMGRFTLFHSFRADETILQGLRGKDGQNILNVLLTVGANATSVTLQADFFMRYDVFFSPTASGGIVLDS